MAFPRADLAFRAVATVAICVVVGVAWSVEAAVWALAALCLLGAALRPLATPDSPFAVRGVAMDVATLASFAVALAFLASVASLG